MTIWLETVIPLVLYNALMADSTLRPSGIFLQNLPELGFYATERELFISAQLSTATVNGLRKLWELRQEETLRPSTYVNCHMMHVRSGLKKSF